MTGLTPEEYDFYSLRVSSTTLSVLLRDAEPLISMGRLHAVQEVHNLALRTGDPSFWEIKRGYLKRRLLGKLFEKYLLHKYPNARDRLQADWADESLPLREAFNDAYWVNAFLEYEATLAFPDSFSQVNYKQTADWLISNKSSPFLDYYGVDRLLSNPEANVGCLFGEEITLPSEELLKWLRYLYKCRF